MELGGNLDQDGGAAALFAGDLIQAERLDRRAELRGQDRDLGDGGVVESGAGRGVYEGDGANHFAPE
jgi:hypothetical protein